MISRDRRTVTKGVAVNMVAAGVLAVGAAVACAATAAADPPPPIPADPSAAPPPAPAPQNAEPTAVGPLAGFAGSGQDFLLGQSAVPAVPGSPQATSLNAGVLSTGEYMLPQNFALAAPDEANPYRMGSGSGNPNLIDSLKGAHAMWHGVMGKMPLDQLGEPLPGTAPPPGTNIPAGLGDNLPDQPPPPLPLPAPPPLPAG